MTAVTRADFFAALFPNVDDGAIIFRALPSMRGESLTLTGAWTEEHDAHLVDLAGTDALYFGVLPRVPIPDGNGGMAPSQKGASCRVARTLWVDIDFKNTPEGDARALLAVSPVPPSIVVHSGGGLHVYWLLRDAVAATDIRPWLERLAGAFKADRSVAEPAHILRVPGTFNYKYTPPRRVTIETFEPTRRYRLGDFAQLPAPEGAYTLSGKLAKPEGWTTPLLGGVAKGSRDDDAIALVGRYSALGLTREEISTTMQAWAAQCDPPFDADKIESMIARIVAKDELRRGVRDGEQNTTDESLAPRWGKEIAGMPTLPIDWYWPGWIAKGSVAVIHGRGDSRKSFLALALGLSTAAGRDLLFEKDIARKPAERTGLAGPSQRGAVLYISAGENSEQEDYRRFKAVCTAHGFDMDIPFGFVTVQEPLLSLNNGAGYARVVQAIEALPPDNRVVIFDSALSISDLEDENNNSLVRRFLRERIMPLSREHGCTVLLIAHAAKAPVQRQARVTGVADPRGASAWRDGVDFNIDVQDDPAFADTSVVRVGKQRIGRRQRLGFRFSITDVPDGLRLRTLPYDEGTAADQAEQAVIRAVEAAEAIVQSGPITTADLTARLLAGQHPRTAAWAAIAVLRGAKAWPDGPHEGQQRAIVASEGKRPKPVLLTWLEAVQVTPGEAGRLLDSAGIRTQYKGGTPCRLSRRLLGQLRAAMRE